MTAPPPDQEPATVPADPWPDSPYPPLALPPGGRPWRRRWRVWTVAVTAVLAAAAFVVVVSWPAGDRPAGGLTFQPIELVRQLEFAQPTDNTFSRLVGDRAYLAWQQGDDLQVAAIDLAGDRRLWQARITGPEGRHWGGLLAGAEAVVAYGDPLDPESPVEAEDPEPVPVVAMDAATGGDRFRWEREVHPEDQMWLAAETLVLVDHLQGALRGLDLETGAPRWAVRFPGPPDAEVAVVPVPAGDPLAAASTWWGAPLAPGVARLVMVGADRSARLIDARDGQVVGTVGTNVADPGDALVAYGGRLFIAIGHVGYHVHARDLSDLAAQPELLYATPDPERGLVAPPMPCGDELLCLLDDSSDDGTATQVRMVDYSADRTGDPQLWHRDVPDGEWLVPVGEWLLVSGYESGLVGVDRDGARVLSHPDGAAARLDAGHLLVFATIPFASPQDLSVAGMAVGAGRTELGQMTAVHGERCSWNATFLVCPGEQDARVWRFATPQE